MPNIEANGANIWYDVQGQGEPIVAIGGMALVSNQFDFCTPHLAEKAQIVNFDLRGVGKSRPIPKLNYTDYADQADDVIAVIEGNEIRQFQDIGQAISGLKGGDQLGALQSLDDILNALGAS